jgi:hypothetical protein
MGDAGSRTTRRVRRQQIHQPVLRLVRAAGIREIALAQAGMEGWTSVGSGECKASS